MLDFILLNILFVPNVLFIQCFLLLFLVPKRCRSLGCEVWGTAQGPRAICWALLRLWQGLL